MRAPARPAALAGAFAALVLAGGALSACSDDAGDTDGARGTSTPAGAPEGDVPAAPVLSDDLAVSQDGSEVLADCWSGICRWSTTDGSLGQVEDGSHVAVDPEWSLIAGVGDGATVVLVDADSGDVVHELAGHTDEEVTDGSPIRAIAFSPDGSLVASAGPDGEVIVWSVEDGEEVATVETTGDTTGFAFSPDGTRLAASAERIEVFDLPSGDRVETLPESTAGAGALAWSPDGRWLAGPGPGAAAAVWETAGFALADQLAGGSVRDLAFDPDSETLAVTESDSQAVRLWLPGTRAEVRDLVGHTEEPGAVVFAPDGGELYSVTGADGVFAWDVRTGTLARQFELPER